MAANPVLRDLSGNGHDIQLYNFAFAESSGCGKYATDFLSFNINKRDRWVAEIKQDIIEITSVLAGFPQLYYQTGQETNINVPSYKIRVIGLTDGQSIRYINSVDGVHANMALISEDGIYTLPSFTYIGKTGIYGFCLTKIQETCNITIEQIPDYQGALVSDGVDDYGLCDNFPILTKEKGYTICAIRKYLENEAKTGALLSDVEVISKPWSVLFEAYGGNGGSNIGTFGSANANLYQLTSNLFTFQTSKSYNGKDIIPGNFDYGNSDIVLFKYYTKLGYYLSFALYALEIYDRDLTDKEIAIVKARMIAEYEENTGNKYEEETV